MGRIIIHNSDNASLIEERQKAFLDLSYAQRFQKAVDLMRVSFLFNKTNNITNKNKILIKQ